MDSSKIMKTQNAVSSCNDLFTNYEGKKDAMLFSNIGDYKNRTGSRKNKNMYILFEGHVACLFCNVLVTSVANNENAIFLQMRI